MFLDSQCSIDGLLDQTAKHMMFLKSVNEQAEKVKKLVSEEKVHELLKLWYYIIYI